MAYALFESSAATQWGQQVILHCSLGAKDDDDENNNNMNEIL